MHALEDQARAANSDSALAATGPRPAAARRCRRHYSVSLRFLGPYSHGSYLVALPELAPIAQYGFLGVPVFFAISGFVIAFSAEGRTPSAGHNGIPNRP